MVQQDIFEIFSRILHQGKKGGKNVALKISESNKTFRPEITSEKKLRTSLSEYLGGFLGGKSGVDPTKWEETWLPVMK